MHRSKNGGEAPLTRKELHLNYPRMWILDKKMKYWSLEAQNV